MLTGVNVLDYDLVVAASTFYGYGALYSDVQVTFSDGATRDIVQKDYPVGNFVACGFAGSEKIGFMLPQSLMDYLASSGQSSSSSACDPMQIAKGWAPIGRRVFASAEAREKN